MNEAQYIQSEVARQASTQFECFHDALVFARTTQQPRGSAEFAKFVQAVAVRVEPDVNNWWVEGPGGMYGRYTNLRQTPVGFMHGGSAAPVNEVSERFFRLMNFYDPGFGVNDVETWIKTLLDIHPWEDGNGRTASIVRNFLLGKLYDPEPLPYYYGES